MSNLKVTPHRRVFRFDEKLGRVVEMTEQEVQAGFRARPGKQGKWGMFQPRTLRSRDGQDSVTIRPGKKTRERMRREL